VAGTYDYADDWALFELQYDFTVGSLTPMSLFLGADSDYASIGANVRSVGYPGYTYDTAFSCVLNQNLSPMLQTNIDITGVLSKHLRYKGDGSKGQSGSALIFCPANDPASCEGVSDPGKIIAVNASFAENIPPLFIDRLVGPKAADFASEALLVLP